MARSKRKLASEATKKPKRNDDVFDFDEVRPRTRRADPKRPPRPPAPCHHPRGVNAHYQRPPPPHHRGNAVAAT